jgi:hypothetical protein
MATKPNPRALRAALSKLSEARAKRGDFRLKIDRERQLLEEEEANLDLANIEGAREVAKKKAELPEVERLLSRYEAASGNFVVMLCDEAEAFERELVQAAAEEREALLDEIAGELEKRGWAWPVNDAGGNTRDLPREIAARMPVLQGLPGERIGGGSLPTADSLANRSGLEPAARDLLDGRVIERAEELLSIFETWTKNGRSFLQKK